MGSCTPSFIATSVSLRCCLTDVHVHRVAPAGTLQYTHSSWCVFSPILLFPQSQSYDGKAADIWSCGIVLYTMLVGKYPFQVNVSGCKWQPTSGSQTQAPLTDQRDHLQPTECPTAHSFVVASACHMCVSPYGEQQGCLQIAPAGHLNGQPAGAITYLS